MAIVDDHPALREGTASLLAREADIEVIALVDDLAGIRALLAGGDPPDVVIQDIRLGEESGLRMLPGETSAETDAGSARRSAIILWTAYDYPQYAAYAMRAGAAGFVVKTAPTAELVAAIRTVAAGGTHFSMRPDLGTRPLTPREMEVLRLVVDGASNDEAAARLGITTRTIEAHLTRLYERTGARSRTELATRALREGWLDLPVDG
ncbi:MAG: response regulator transcription factor [Chloroflexi bacterium]|nr:response regulator transcription factor [Chloroflexota bacterium]